jgi:hypothetical protein
MADGITIKSEIEKFEEWRRSLNLKLDASVDTFDTGEIRTKKRNDTTITTHRGKWETFDLIIKEVLNTTTGKRLFYLTIKGSLHKNFYGGSNYLPFNWQQLQEQINHLCNALSINPSQAQISSLEIGVNIRTPFEVTPFLMGNIISYKGNSFNRYKKDAAGFCLGIVCNLSQYAVKIYDKGLQNKLPYNLMRFELRYLKMQALNNRGIKYLSDLQNFKKVYSLHTMLLNAWNDVLIFDVLQPVKKLPIKQRGIDLLIEGQNPKFWERLKETKTRDRFKYLRNRFKMLVAKYGNKWQSLVHGLLLNEWQTLFKNYPNLPTGKNEKLPILTIKINGKNGEKSFTDAKRFCLSCSKELNPEQKPNSKYCSSKFVGEAAAHHCRNNNSNPRNNLKRKIELIQGRGVLFDIIPFIANNNNKQSYGI